MDRYDINLVSIIIMIENGNLVYIAYSNHLNISIDYEEMERGANIKKRIVYNNVNIVLGLVEAIYVDLNECVVRLESGPIITLSINSIVKTVDNTIQRKSVPTVMVANLVLCFGAYFMLLRFSTSIILFPFVSFDFL